MFLAGATTLVGPGRQEDRSRKKIYEAQKCATCHMIAGKGNKMYPLDGVGAKLSAPTSRSGSRTPPRWKPKLSEEPTLKMSSKKYDLKDADLDALVAYMQSLK